ncbi:hypothetical protein CHS0354_022798 [Potamilus streckersoni]|uniref:Uncharacterized protein n=1 Tax=Potamilus streckersoni TaxID=2493646 RepID=A0AAE0S1Q0_9BIVA|nr:hypothetical protein CHS0354_022798 [Potamilus streckersoni]
MQLCRDVARHIDKYFGRFISLVNASVDITKRDAMTRKNMRRYFLHILNGVDQLYKGIDDPEISIRIQLRQFVVFEVLVQLYL